MKKNEILEKSENIIFSSKVRLSLPIICLYGLFAIILCIAPYDLYNKPNEIFFNIIISLGIIYIIIMSFINLIKQNITLTNKRIIFNYGIIKRKKIFLGYDDIKSITLTNNILKIQNSKLEIIKFYYICNSTELTNLLYNRCENIKFESTKIEMDARQRKERFIDRIKLISFAVVVVTCAFGFLIFLINSSDNDRKNPSVDNSANISACVYRSNDYYKCSWSSFEGRCICKAR